MATTGVPSVLYETNDAPDLVSGAFAQHTHVLDEGNLSFVSESNVTSMRINTGSTINRVAVGDYGSISYAPAKGVFSNSGELLKLTGVIPWSFNSTIKGFFTLEFNISATLNGKDINANVPGSGNVSFPVLLIKGNSMVDLPDNMYPGVCVCRPIASNGKIDCLAYFNNVPSFSSDQPMLLVF